MSTQILEAPAPVSAARPRLSALMRAGAQVHPQGHGALYYDGHTCAMGALMVGVLLERGMSQADLPDALCAGYLRNLIMAHTGVDPDTPVISPVGGQEVSLALAVIRLNDGARWTREAIASWLASIGF